jgi:transcriptional regulator with XRE-family HTH domain
MQLSELIQAMQNKTKMNQDQLSAALNISQSAISEWLNGRQTISAGSVKKLREFCKKHKIKFNIEDIF